MEAATRGAVEATIIVLNIVSIVIACMACMAFFNALVSYFFGLIGFDHVNFEWLLGKAFVPLAFVMGVPWEDCEIVGYLIGVKVMN